MRAQNAYRPAMCKKIPKSRNGSENFPMTPKVRNGSQVQNGLDLRNNSKHLIINNNNDESLFHQKIKLHILCYNKTEDKKL